MSIQTQVWPIRHNAAPLYTRFQKQNFPELFSACIGKCSVTATEVITFSWKIKQNWKRLHIPYLCQSKRRWSQYRRWGTVWKFHVFIKFPDGSPSPLLTPSPFSFTYLWYMQAFPLFCLFFLYTQKSHTSNDMRYFPSIFPPQFQEFPGQWTPCCNVYTKENIPQIQQVLQLPTMRTACWWFVMNDVNVSRNHRQLIVTVVDYFPAEISWLHNDLAIATRQWVIPVDHTCSAICKLVYSYISTLPPLGHIWDVMLVWRNINKLSVCYGTVYYHNGAQWCEQFLQVGWVDQAVTLLDLAHNLATGFW